MADNYLEKRMEEYRAGKLAPKSRVVYASGAKREPGEFALTFRRCVLWFSEESLSLSGRWQSRSDLSDRQLRYVTRIRNSVRR